MKGRPFLAQIIDEKIKLYGQIPIYPSAIKVDRTRLSDRSAFLCEDDKCNVSWVSQAAKDSFMQALMKRKKEGLYDSKD